MIAHIHLIGSAVDLYVTAADAVSCQSSIKAVRSAHSATTHITRYAHYAAKVAVVTHFTARIQNTRYFGTMSYVDERSDIGVA
jgi:hypothetical protein